ncbi:DUF4132 domain-containing protein [Flavivirga algicola]|uniref:DUF4132 domain-containing protein n=1 Tax=Flavivirga algicola TaxID=2729136 RepID=A0ABX1RT79_9FLAO|nr:DUF4132 domain-containing protein [Flavivirga algicola]NMH86762.1 DUF4132 domain-containing protein [Flavivirga algicola]
MKIEELRKRVELFKTKFANNKLDQFSDQEIKHAILDINECLIDLIKFRKKNDYHYEESELCDYTAEFRNSLVTNLSSYTEEEWIVLQNSFLKLTTVLGNTFRDRFLTNAIIKSLEKLENGLGSKPPSEKIISFILKLLSLPYYASYSIHQKDAQAVRQFLIKYGYDEPFQFYDTTIDDRLNKIIDSIKNNRNLFNKTFILFASAFDSKPSDKFKREVSGLIQQIGEETYLNVARQLLMVCAESDPVRKDEDGFIIRGFLGDTEIFLQGLIWSLVSYPDENTIKSITNIAEKAYVRIRVDEYESCIHAQRLGNICINVLGEMCTKDSLLGLTKLRLNIKHKAALKNINKNLEAGAKKHNISIEEIEESVFPDFDLVEGKKQIKFEDYTLRIDLTSGKIIQQWFKPDGSTMKSVPSIVKNDESLSSRLKIIKKEAKEIQKYYGIKKQMIDNQIILKRSIDYLVFKKEYEDHGLVSTITKKLIWVFTKGGHSQEAIYIDGYWESKAGERLNPDNEVKVMFWHPIYVDANNVLEWREKMIELEWKQPIKQAFREVYLLTDAEQTTRTYSNRMAAHILKQHQFSTLAKLRGWSYSLIGSYDDGISNVICSKELKKHKIRAEFWIDELNMEDAYNDSGIWLYVTTDQVKFTDEKGASIPLETIPKIVFSEVMRDIDLFVGVTSVGNDPEWLDKNGERQNTTAYWREYSFGDLTQIAKTRKEILQKLLPRLTKLKGKSSIDGRFLIVEGKLRTYKIHIGSGNILMNPNDEYLCIVPARSDKKIEKVFVPFEGDRGLSIVLSKAFLLVEDNKIKDSTIISQISIT